MQLFSHLLKTILMKKTILAALAMVLMTFTGNAQAPDYISDGALLDGKTIVKADVMGLGLRNFSFSAERVINKNLSINLGIRFMPEGGIPGLSLIEKQIGDVEGIFLADTKINSFAFTPELRIYLGKYGYGRGFYIAPYYNYFGFNLSNLKVEYEVKNALGQKETENVILDGGIKTHSGGLMFGYQWLVGAKKNIVIDWGIFGVHAGKSTGELNGLSSRTLTTDEQETVKETIDDNLSKVPFFKFTSTVNAKDVKIEEKGPWGFIRGSLSIGFRF